MILGSFSYKQKTHALWIRYCYCLRVSLTDITTIQRRSRSLWRSSVTHLVVHDEVDAPTHSVVRKVWEGQGFWNDPLTSERAIAMDLWIHEQQRSPWSFSKNVIMQEGLMRTSLITSYKFNHPTMMNRECKLRKAENEARSAQDREHGFQLIYQTLWCTCLRSTAALNTDLFLNWHGNIFYLFFASDCKFCSTVTSDQFCLKNVC